MKPCVLIAEKDGMTRNGYRRALARRGYRVETASDGLECMSKLNREPDVVVLDCDLLWGGAEGVVAQIREQWGITSVPVILIAYDDYCEEFSELIVDPVVACLHKPFHIDTLFQCIAAADKLLTNAVGEQTMEM